MPVVVPVMRAVTVMSSGKVFVHFAVGEYDDHVGLGTAQRDVVAHDFIFDRVFQGGVEYHFDPLPADEPHLDRISGVQNDYKIFILCGGFAECRLFFVCQIIFTLYRSVVFVFARAAGNKEQSRLGVIAYAECP